MLIGLQALELAPKKAAGTAAGFTGLFGYLGGSVAANALVGYTVDHFGWDGGFKLLIGACLLAILFLYFVSTEQGAYAVFEGMYVHEFVHDGRHLLGFPCH